MTSSIFSYAWWTFVYLLWRKVYSKPSLIFKHLIVCLFVVIGVLNIQDILNIHLSIFSSIQNHTRYTIFKYFGPSCGLSFHSLDSVLIYWCSDLLFFKFLMKSNLPIFFFYWYQISLYFEILKFIHKRNSHVFKDAYSLEGKLWPT